MAGLTEHKISKLKWDDSKLTRAGNRPKFQQHDDPEVPGHHIRLYPPKANGRSSKVFYLQYGPNVGRKVYRIGSWGDPWSLEDARNEAKRVRGAFLIRGLDPNEAKQQKIQEAKAALTVEQLVDRFFEAHPVPVWSAGYRGANRTHARKLTKVLGNRIAETVDKDDIRLLFLRVKEETPSQAKLFRGFVKRAYDWGQDEDLLPEMTNPAILVRSKSKAKSQYQDPRPVERDRVLESDKGEATALFDLLKKYDPIYTHAAKLYLLTGFRNAELRTARWEHVDLKNRTLKNVSPKGGPENAYKAYLSDMAIDCLKSLGLGRFAEGPIFPAAGLFKPTSEPRSDWAYWTKTISMNSGMPRSDEGEPIWIHDLRRTAVTWLAEMRVSNDSRTIFKGSRPTGVTARTYSHAQKVPVHKRCTLQIEDRINDIESGDEKTMFEPWRRALQATESP